MLLLLLHLLYAVSNKIRNQLPRLPCAASTGNQPRSVKLAHLWHHCSKRRSDAHNPQRSSLVICIDLYTPGECAVPWQAADGFALAW